MKKFLSFLLLVLLGTTVVTGCNNDNDDTSESGGTCTGGDMTLDEINEIIQNEEHWDSSYGNPVALIPFNHIDGPKNEWKFYAIVHFQSKEATYVKYQVTYLSCTCRDKNVNYWSTAYIEMTTPKNSDNAKLRALSFDQDGTGHYTAGYWGDSDPIPNGTTYQDIKDKFIPLLINKTHTQIDSYNTVVQMNSADVLSDELYDEFTGASVSTNNILRMLHAVFDYHAKTWWTTETE